MTKLTLRIPDSLHARLKAQAERDVRSVNGELVYLIDFALKELEKREPPTAAR